MVFGVVAWFGPIEAVTGPLIDVAAAGLVAFATQEWSWLARALGWTPLVRLGVISYSLYLWHMLVISWFHGHATRLRRPS